MDKPRISCIVCTYNRQDFILQCLEALTTQTLDPKGYEVIVVDNHSKDGTASLANRFIESHPQVDMVYTFEERQGLSHARNAGARMARSDILTYIDDDAVAHPLLLEEILRVFDTYPFAGCVGGRIELALPSDLPWWYSEALAGYFSHYALDGDGMTKISKTWQLPYGANFTVRKKPLSEAGGFSTQLGRKGKDFSGGEEIDLAYRIAARGYDLYYNPSAKVTHHILRDRMTLQHMTHSARSSAKVWVYLERELMRSNTGVQGDLKNLTKDLTKFFLYLGRDPWRKRFCFFLQALHHYEKVRAKMAAPIPSLRGQPPCK